MNGVGIYVGAGDDDVMCSVGGCFWMMVDVLVMLLVMIGALLINMPLVMMVDAMQ